MIVNNKNKNINKQFVLGKGLVEKTNFVHSNVHSMQPYIEHNSNEIGNIQLKDKNTKRVKELNKTLHVNNKLYLTKLISGGGTQKLGGGFIKLN